MPAYAAGVIVFAYWGYVVAKLIRIRRRADWRQAAIPRQTLEQILWVVWVPLIVLWIALPFVSANQSPERQPFLAIPSAMQGMPILAIRWLAVLAACLAFVGSLACWRSMGRSWRMAVDENVKTLLTTGPFSRVRHPIYSLSMLLMISTVVAAPSGAMLLVAAIHLTFLVVKATNEERFLRRLHGTSYDAYAQRTGRFLPRWFGRSVEEIVS